MSDELLALAQSKVPNVSLSMISQGAESLIFTTESHPYLPQKGTYIIKFRPPKTYRHPRLDALLTKHRTLAEARLLQKLYPLQGMKVPGLIAVDSRNGVLWMEYIGEELANGVSSLKNYLWLDGDDSKRILTEVGAMIAQLHLHGVVHGDLTTSNVMLFRDESWHPCLIDFGLGSQSELAEDKAVDLYVLERAILSTHPVKSEEYNEWLMEGYRSAYKDQNKLKQLLKRYEDVRLRGRKRSMLG